MTATDSNTFGEHAFHLDAALGPDFRLAWRATRPGTSLHILVPFGISATWMDQRTPGYAVQSKYDLGWGINQAVIVGYDFTIMNSTKGLTFDVGMTSRTTWITKTETLAASGEQAVQRQLRSEVGVLASIGFAGWL